MATVTNRPPDAPARALFAPGDPPDKPRFDEIDHQIDLDHIHGALTVRGVALFYWLTYADRDDRWRWVLAENERQIARAGWLHTNWGYLPSGAIDLGPDVVGGIRHLGRIGEGSGQCDRVIMTAVVDRAGRVVSMPYQEGGQ